MASKNARRRARQARAKTQVKTRSAAVENSDAVADPMAWLVPQQLPWLQAS